MSASPVEHTRELERSFHPGEDRKRDGLYIAFDAEHASTILDKPVAYQTTATTITVLAVGGELVLFYLIFGIWGLLAISMSTACYTLLDKRARACLKGLLKNNSAGSDGSA